MKAQITKMETIAEDTIQVTFDFSDTPFSFIAGQYVRVTLPELYFADPRGSSRDFSIASSPNLKNSVIIAFRVSGSSFKQTLSKLPLGTSVVVEGPFGVFTLPKATSSPIVFIAGGIGVTPFFSMICFATEENLPCKVTLLYANRSVESSAFLAELNEFQQNNPHFRLKTHLGDIDESFLRGVGLNYSESLWYLAGPPGMVTVVRTMILGLGAIEEKIIVEEFVGY